MSAFSVWPAVTPAAMETVNMSYEELDRVRVIERVIERRLTQREAARMRA